MINRPIIIRFIAGIPSEDIPDEVDRLLQTMLLEPFADIRAGTLR